MDGSVILSTGTNVHLHVIHASLSQPKSIPQMTSGSFQPFLCNSWQTVLIYYSGPPPFPQNCAFHGWILTPSSTWFLGPTWIHNPNSISVGSAIFAGLTIVTDRPDRQTDHTTPSVTIGRIYICSTVMRPNNDVRNRYGDGSTRAPLRWTLASCSKYSYLNVLVTVNSNKLLQCVLAKACNTQSNIDGWHCWPSYSVTDTTANNVDKNDSWQCQSSAVNVGLCITDITLVDLDSALKWLFFNGNNNRPTHFKTTLSFYLQMLNS